MNRSILLAIVTSCFLLGACTATWHALVGTDVRQGVSSSLVEYLYPNNQIPPDYHKTIPNLTLPLRVGLAFVPAYSNNAAVLTESNKHMLLEKVKAEFANRDFISEIVVIPDTYLRAGRGFRTIEQVARLHGVDVMALVSYDQMAYVDDTRLSILYWTVIGAYTVKGSKNDIQTFVDTAIFDVKTNKLLFRAPGINNIAAKSTLIDSAEHLRKAREDSFALAMSDMTGNLSTELDRFKEDIKANETVIITHHQGYGGGGAFGLPTILLLVTGLFARQWRHRHS